MLGDWLILEGSVISIAYLCFYKGYIISMTFVPVS
jgi:hypothetical protein